MFTILAGIILVTLCGVFIFVADTEIGTRVTNKLNLF